MPEYASAVPLNDIYSARTREHQNWQLNFRSAFMLTSNDTFRYRLVEEDNDAAYDAWRALPNLSISARYNLGDSSRIPVHRTGLRHGARRRIATHSVTRLAEEQENMANPMNE